MNKYKNLTKMRVLIVEDNLVLQDILNDLLCDIILEIEFASNGQEALDIYEKNRFDIVLSDYEMPHLNGLEMSKQIREVNPEQYIVFITAHIKNEVVLDSINMQINKFITKPIIDFEIFLESLDSVAKEILQNRVELK